MRLAHATHQAAALRRPAQVAGRLLVAAAFTLAGGAISMAASPKSIAGRTRDLPRLIADVNAALNVDSSTLAQLTVPRTPGAPVSTVVPINGQQHTLDLVPYSVRSNRFELKVQVADGSLVTIDPGPVRTLRGTVRGIEGSVVAAAIMDDGLYARIILPQGPPDAAAGFDEYWVEPVGDKVAGVAGDDHAIYRSLDVIPSGRTCLLRQARVVEEQTVDTEGGIAAGTGIFTAELLIDADLEYFQSFGTVSATVAAIENIINTMDVQFERDVSIKHFISTIIVRTAEPDPYDTTCIGGGSNNRTCQSSSDCPGGICAADANTLLAQFRLEWVLSPTPRDIAQLFTGKNLAGNTIGIAWLGSICLTSLGYSVVQSNCCGSFACKTDLSAHELGHNWGAGHCSCSQFTMNSGLTCSNQFNPTFTIPSILTHRDSRTCLTEGNALQRVIVRAERNTVAEDGTLQLSAEADFQLGTDPDVTSEVQWSLDPPDSGTIDSSGLFTPAEVDGDTCVIVTASLTVDGVTRTDDKSILVTDLDIVRAIIVTLPPQGAIDARQPTDPDGSDPANPQAGAAPWQTLDITYNGDTCLLLRESFAVSQLGGVLTPPAVVAVEQLGPRTVRLHLTDSIEPGAVTVVTDITSDLFTDLGSLPGDVNADRTSNADDILALLDVLDGTASLPAWSSDLDRSTTVGPLDLLRLVDLLNGADAYEVWNGRSLP